MVFGEYLPKDDYSKLEESNWAKELFKKEHDYLEKLNPESPKNIDAQIKKDQKALAKFAYYHKTRMNLAVNYAKNWDRGNADYQIFVLENYMKQHFGREELATYTKMFGSTDSLKKIGFYRPGSEYSKFISRLFINYNKIVFIIWIAKPMINPGERPGVKQTHYTRF
jgi:hypothetical protein